jgi:Cu(I)/Ag(I) efflux system membrane fusion protein
MSPQQRSAIISALTVTALAVTVAVLHGPLVAWFTGQPVGGHQTAPVTANLGPLIDHYTCSMHPSVSEPGPGTCPICGMNLVPVTKEQQEQGIVTIDEPRRQLIGVRVAPVIEGPMRRTVRAVGRVAYDESSLTDVSLKVRGWVTKLYVRETGQHVARGQPLFALYSPELYNAEQDLLLATQAATGAGLSQSGSHPEGLGAAARQRLQLLGVTEEQIDQVVRKNAPSESITFGSPAAGFVIEKNVVEGASIDTGARLFRIASLDKVWVEADVYEQDLANIRVGQRAEVTLDYSPGRSYEANVAYVYPYLDTTARTDRARIELANPSLDLRPGMLATVELSADLGTALQVPASAVVYTGPRRLVFVDLGQGRLRPREVEVGAESGGMYEVRSGLQAGDVVATSGVFLIAAEARIRTAAKYWEPEAPVGSAPLPTPIIPPPSAPTPTVRAAPLAERPAPAPTIYTCPMHPDVQSPSPGKCPRCGMDLVPRNAR